MRYKLSQAKENIKKSKRPWLIIISGVPNTGKSTIAIKLAAKLNWSVCVGVDQMKEVVKKYDSNPYIKRSSHDCWELIGKRTKRNILLGFKRYCKGIEVGVDPIIDRSKITGENIILEGVQLLPELFKKIKGFNKVYILIRSNFDREHYGKMDKKIKMRHMIQTDVWSKREPELRLIQDALKKSVSKSKSCYIIHQVDQVNIINKIINILAKYEAV